MSIQAATLIQGALFLSVCIAAIWKGGPAERVAGVSLATQLILAEAFLDHAQLSRLQLPVLTLDLVQLGVLYALTLKSDRRWLLAATAFQLLAALSQVAKALDPAVSGWAFLTASIFWGYGVLIALAVGVTQHARSRSFARS